MRSLQEELFTSRGGGEKSEISLSNLDKSNYNGQIARHSCLENEQAALKP